MFFTHGAQNIPPWTTELHCTMDKITETLFVSKNIYAKEKFTQDLDTMSI